MSRFQNSINVNCPPQKAYDYLSDISHHVDFSSHGLVVEKTSAVPVGIGATYATTGQQMGTHKGVVTITELVPGQKIVYESNDDTGRIRHFIELAPENGGTHITKGFETVKTGMLLTVFRPMMYIVAPRNMKGDLVKIKAQLES